MKILLMILGVIVAVSLLVGGTMLLRYYMAGLSGRLTANEQIQSGQHRVVAYNHFFDLCAGVRTNEQSLEAQTDLLDNNLDSLQKIRIQTNISGLIGNRASLIEEYNANARKDYTEGQFRDSNLPWQLPTLMWEKGYRTSCGN